MKTKKKEKKTGIVQLKIETQHHIEDISLYTSNAYFVSFFSLNEKQQQQERERESEKTIHVGLIAFDQRRTKTGFVIRLILNSA